MTHSDSVCPIIYLVATIKLAGSHRSCAPAFDMVLICFHDVGADRGTQQILLRITSVVNILIMPANSALFFMRVRAIYSGNKYVTIFFGGFLLAILVFFVYESVVGLTVCSGSGASSARCYKNKYSDAWAYIATAVYDTLMYLSISWQLASYSTSDKWQAPFRSFFTGDGLGWLSKVLLQSGQLYYS